MLRRTIFGQSIKEIESPSWIFDTSTFYSNDPKLTVQRKSDSAIQIFTPLQISDGTYAAWLNGSDGILTSIKSDGTIKNEAIGSSFSTAYSLPKLLDTGVIDMLEGYSNLTTPFNHEINLDVKMAMVIRNPNNQNNGRVNMGAVGSNSGVGLNYRSVARRWYFGWKTPEGTDLHYYINTPAMIDANFNNVVVFEMPNNIPRIIANGVSYTAKVASDASWTYFVNEIGASKMLLGNRSSQVAKIAQYKNFSMYLNTTKTADEISAELISIHQ